MTEHDVTILERYWRSYRSYRSRLANPHKETEASLSSLERIVSGLEETFNQMDEEMKWVIETMYWQNETYTWSDSANALHMSLSKLYNKRKYLLQKTAENIGYI